MTSAGDTADADRAVDVGVAAAEIAVEVVFCARPGHADSVTLRLPTAATVEDALRASGLVERHALHWAELQVGVWSRRQPLQAPLRERDRVEIYRGLSVDPKEARRLRYAQHRDRVKKA
jgi:putative ubiquitin-RnfH superfamily antitoxin RatB of RatAB toxin-antitoxin module